jgi:hypothetical protein
MSGHIRILVAYVRAESAGVLEKQESNMRTQVM